MPPALALFADDSSEMWLKALKSLKVRLESMLFYIWNLK